MYFFSRLMLLLTAALVAYCLLVAAILGLVKVAPENRGGVVIAFMAVVALLGTKKVRHLFTSGGTAAWASFREMEKAGMLRARGGLILGRVAPDGNRIIHAIKALLNPLVGSADACREMFEAIDRRKRKQGRIVRLPQAVHTAVFAPTGVGKGVSFIVPFLLTSKENCVVIDFKGENAMLTANHRKRMGHVVILDPYKVVTQQPDTFNPFDFIDPASSTAIDDCRDIAEALVVRTGEEKDPHWNDSAEDVIGALSATTVHYGQKDKSTRSLHTVADLLSHPKKWETMKKLMQEHGGLLGQWGDRLEHLQGEEKNSVFSTTNRFLRFLGTPAIVESTQSSSFDPSLLKRGKMTVYLVLPPERMRAQSPLLRLWIGSMFRAIVHEGLGEGKKVHFVLDESASLGHMQQLNDAVDKYRGYGIRLQFYYQSLGQLKTCWPTDQGQTLLSNTTKVFFGVNDIHTAEFVSKSLGNSTILVEGWSSNSGWSRGRSSSSGASHSESSSTSQSGGASSDRKQQTRELLKPDEVISLDPRIAITLTPGVRPLWSRLIRYYEEKDLFNFRWWKRLRAAAIIFFRSMALLILAVSAAALLTSELADVAKREQTAAAPAVQNPQFRPTPFVNNGGRK